MSTLSYNVGYTLGTVAREFLRVMKSPKHTAPVSPLIAKQLLQAAPHPSGQVLETMRQVPAIVRLKGVDLNSWYEANTRVVAVKKPARQRKPRTPGKTVEAAAKGLQQGCLSDLIAPIEHMLVDSHSTQASPVETTPGVEMKLVEPIPIPDRFSDYRRAMECGITDEQFRALGD
ncbi:MULTISPECIES: hypothetical protein [unclassified Pseudomonas]|uniref:hypothetical protein n=1 Tax=unclassified Pseudomonas TaxID=196821 RepID=UPI000689066C|nr:MULTISPECIES: hypothetical protein [unclassified Pseudomonas]SMF20118.1 hypothetical protein SAMN05660912_02068 [Pseudomonas sp. LAMO17WK12:I1]